MSLLLNIITDALDGIDIEGSIGGEAENLLAIANSVAQLTQGQPPELSSFIDNIAEIDLPDFNFGADLTSQVQQVSDLVPTDMGDMLKPITDGLAKVDGGLGEGVTDLIGPMVDSFRAIQTLLHTNFNFTSAEESGGAPPPQQAQNSSIISSNPETQIDPVRLQSFQTVLDDLPAEPTIVNTLEWFNEKVQLGNGEIVATLYRNVPYLKDIKDPLNTVLSWRSLSSAELVDQINSSLSSLGQALNNQINNSLSTGLQELNDLVGQLDLEELGDNITDIVDLLDRLRQNIVDDTLTEALLEELEDELTPLLTQRDALVQQFTDTIKENLEQQLVKVENIPRLLQERMSSFILMLQPPAGFGQEVDHGQLPAPLPGPSSFTGLDHFLEEYCTIFENLMSALDISEITEAFKAPGETMEEAADEIDQAITMVTLEITNRLNQVQDLISSVNIPGVVDTAEQAIEDYTGEMTSTLASSFAEVRQAIETISNQISTIVNSFNPASVVSTIEEGMESVADVLENNDEISTVLEVAEKLKSIAERLDRLSFTPVTDQVVSTIDEMKTSLQTIGGNLDDPLKGMLSSAIDVLPDDLTPVTDPLIEGLGEVIETGPIPLLEGIKDVPQQIVDAINSFDPAALIGDSLSVPYQNILGEIESFEPNEYLDPINAEIEGFKERIRENVRPGDLLDPLIALHDQVMADLDGFKPSELIEPVNLALTEAVEKVTESLPIEGIFDEIEAVIIDIQRVLGVDGVADSILQLIRRLQSFLEPFVAETEQISEHIQSWLDSILDGLVNGLDVSSLQTAFDSFNTTLDNCQASALQTLYDQGTAPVITAVKDTLNPRSLMTTLVASHSQLRAAADSMTDLANQTRVNSILLNVNPTAPDFSSVFTTYGRVITVMDEGQQQITATLDDWDELFHSADGVLSSYRQIPASPQQLKDWLIESLDNQLIKPLKSIFEKFAPTSRLLDGFIQPLVDLVESLRTTVTNIISAPAALLAVGEALERIRDRLQEVNLDFISQSIDGIYNEVKTQLRGLDPRGLKTVLNSSFEELIDVISLDAIVPVDALNQADDDIDQAIEGLRQLDPQILIGEVIQPKFEEILAPFVSALDLTPALTSLAERLKPIEDELSTEMDRVNQAYQGFLSAAPS